MCHRTPQQQWVTSSNQRPLQMRDVRARDDLSSAQLAPANRSRPARTAIPWWSSLIRQMRAQSLESVAHGGQSAVQKPWHLRESVSKWYATNASRATVSPSAVSARIGKPGVDGLASPQAHAVRVLPPASRTNFTSTP